MELSFMNVTPAGEFGIVLNHQKYQKISHLNKGIVILTGVLLTR
jgi:hypothetical protein